MPAGLDIVVASDVSWYHTVAVTVCSGSLHCKVLFLWPIKRIRYQQFIFCCCSCWQTFLCTVCLDFHSWSIWSIYTSVGQKQEVKKEEHLRYFLKQIFTDDASQPYLRFDRWICGEGVIASGELCSCECLSLRSVLESSKVGDSQVSFFSEGQDIIITR